MCVDVKHACTYMLKDSGWIKKILLGGLLVVFPMFGIAFPGIKRMFSDPYNACALLFFSLVSVGIYLAIVGYFFKTLHLKILGTSENLPEWNGFFELIKIGAKAYIGTLLFYLPIALVMGLCYIFLIPVEHTMLYAGLCFFAHIFIAALYMPFMMSFAVDLKVTSFVNADRAFLIVAGDFRNFLILVMCVFAISFCFGFVASILSLSGLLTLFIPFIAFYVYVVMADLFAQLTMKEALRL